MSANAQRRQHRPPPPVAGLPAAGVDELDGVVIVTPVETLRDPLPAGLVEQLQALIAAGR